MHGTGDDEARQRGTQKSILERQAPPTFPVLIEMRERTDWVTHWTQDSVDCLLQHRMPMVQVGARSTMRFGSIAQALAECKLESYRIAECAGSKTPPSPECWHRLPRSR